MQRFLVVAVLALASPAHAEPDLYAGLNLRADSGAHPFRVLAGVDTGPFDLSFTLDPQVGFDGQLAADLLTVTKVTDGGWGILLGWRTTAIGILGGHQLQEKPLVGISAPLPRLGDLPIRARWGVEAATVIVKHGGGLPTSWI